jgi:hypothetical protein
MRPLTSTIKYSRVITWQEEKRLILNVANELTDSVKYFYRYFVDNPRK